MTDNKKALIRESINSNAFIIPDNPSKSNVKDNMPAIVGDIVTLLQTRLIDLSFNCCLNMLIYMLFAMISSKRVYIKKHADSVMKITLSWYAIVFSGSGTGKDYCIKILKELIFKKYYDVWFLDKINDFIKKEEYRIKQEANTLYSDDADIKKNLYIKNELAKVRKPKTEIIQGTQEGLYAEAKVLDSAKFGSLNIRNSEYGRYIKTRTVEKEMFDNCLYNGYDGNIESKAIKGNAGEENINNLPVNMLCYSDYSIFINEMKNTFNDFMEAGIGRRAIFSFQAKRPLKTIDKNNNDSRVFELNALNLGDKLFNIFVSIKNEAQFTLSKSANDIYIDYVNYLRKNAYNLDSLFEKEFLSREYKALKLSCVYAALNHPGEQSIKDTDIKQAIYTIQTLSNDLSAFYNYRPETKDIYNSYYSVLKNNLEQRYTKMDLIKEFMKFGAGREKIRKNFDEIIDTLKEMAIDDGYRLDSKPINNNSGNEYFLYKIPSGELNDNIKKLEKLITPVNAVSGVSA